MIAMRSGRRGWLKMMLGAGVAFAARSVQADETPAEKLITAARAQIGVTLIYDPGYARIDYPNGDIGRIYGVCADVIVRAYRDALTLDLQELLHRDMKKNFAAYPATWGLDKPDSNIDHRRVLNIETFLKRQGAQLWRNKGNVTDGAKFPEVLQNGDIVTWRLNGRLPHIAFIGETGEAPSVIHNIGWGARENALAAYRHICPSGITGGPGTPSLPPPSAHSAVHEVLLPGVFAGAKPPVVRRQVTVDGISALRFGPCARRISPPPPWLYRIHIQTAASSTSAPRSRQALRWLCA